MKLIVTGGGTGGHIQPIVALVEHLRSLDNSWEVLWLGSKNGPEGKVAQKNQINFVSIPCGKFRRYGSLQNLVDLFKIPFGILKSLFVIIKFRPNVVFGKGGYVSLPVIIAAFLMRKPTLIHESDVVPGLSNRLLSKLADRVAISYKDSERYLPKEKTVLTGTPVRKEVLSGNIVEGHSFFGLTPIQPTIFVIGGSQGSQRINDLILENLPQLLEKYQIIHMTGDKEINRVNNKFRRMLAEHLLPEKPAYRSYPFLDKGLPHAYTISELIISRSGANTLAELALLGKPVILIPLSTSSADHQRANALVYLRDAAAVMLEEKDLDANTLLNKINDLMLHREKLVVLSQSITRLSKPEAAKVISEVLVELSRLN